MTDKKLPGLPPVPPTVKDKGTRHFLHLLREAVAVRFGQAGDELEQVVTRKDLVDSGLASIRPRGWFGGGTNSGPFVPPVEDLSPPPRPTGVTATGGFDRNYIEWDNPGLVYDYFTEIWRDTQSVFDTATAELIGTAPPGAVLYADDPRQDTTTFYYWVRFVRTVGSRQLYGPIHDLNGVSAAIQLNPQFIVDQMTGMVTESQLAASLATKIDGIETKAEISYVDGQFSSIYTVKLDANGRIAGFGISNSSASDSEFIVAADKAFFLTSDFSGAFDPNYNYTVNNTTNNLPSWFVMGWAKINGAARFAINAPVAIPEATITSAHIKNLDVTKIVGDIASFLSANITDGFITNAMIGNYIQSDNYVAGSTGWRLDKTGSIEANNITIRDSAGNIILTTTGIPASAVSGLGALATRNNVTTTYIANAAVTNAKIGNAAVDTLQLAGNAVTVPMSAAWGWLQSSGKTYTLSLGTYNHGYSSSIPGVIFVRGTYGGYTGGALDKSFTFEILIGGVVVYSETAKTTEMYNPDTFVALDAFVLANIPAGNNVVSIRISNALYDIRSRGGKFLMLGTKR